MYPFGDATTQINEVVDSGPRAALNGEECGEEASVLCVVPDVAMRP